MSVLNYLKENLRETSISKEDFLSKHNINPDDLHYLGKGDNGEAYIVNVNDVDIVLKITSSKREYDIAKEIMDVGNIHNIAKIYDTAYIDGYYYILQEYINEDSDIEYKFYEALELISSQGHDLVYNNFDASEYEEENGSPVDDDILEFMNELDDVVRAYKRLGVYPPDISSENLGRSSDGTLTAFDIDIRGR